MKTLQPQFIAEIGMNHNGNFGLFFELIKQASLAGADFAKFQLGWRSKPGEINELKESDVTNILKCCDYHNIEPLFSVFDRPSFELLESLELKAYKIASRTVNEQPQLVWDVVKTGKRVFVSLGMTDDKMPFGNHENISYLWCQASYPVLPWELKNFPEKFCKAGVIGLSDHTVGIELPLIAITRGAKIIEKHFTLDKSDTKIRDHALSLLPEEFRQMVILGKAMQKIIDSSQ